MTDLLPLLEVDSKHPLLFLFTLSNITFELFSCQFEASPLCSWFLFNIENTVCLLCLLFLSNNWVNQVPKKYFLFSNFLMEMTLWQSLSPTINLEIICIYHSPIHIQGFESRNTTIINYCFFQLKSTFLYSRPTA